MKYFKITEDTEIYLYGDNEVSKGKVQSLRESKYNICGIIDRKYFAPIEEDGLLFQDLNSFSQGIHAIGDNYAVVICLRDASKHEDVVKELLQMGVFQVLFLPMSMQIPVMNQNLLRKEWRLFFENRFHEMEPIPIFEFSDQDNTIVIEKDEKGISFFCNIRNLYVATEEIFREHSIFSGFEEYQKSFQLMQPYLDQPVKNLTPYIELFNYLSGSCTSVPAAYLKASRQMEDERKELLENRGQLFRLYEAQYKYNFNFFLQSPISVQWNRGGITISLMDCIE